MLPAPTPPSTMHVPAGLPKGLRSGGGGIGTRWPTVLRWPKPGRSASTSVLWWVASLGFFKGRLQKC